MYYLTLCSKVAFSCPYITGVEALDSIVYNTRKIVSSNYLNFTFSAIIKKSYNLDFRSSSAEPSWSHLSSGKSLKWWLAHWYPDGFL